MSFDSNRRRVRWCLAIATIACGAGLHGQSTRIATRTTLSVGPSPSAAGQPVTLTALVEGLQEGDRPLGAVEFYNGPNLLGRGVLPPTGDVRTVSLVVTTLSVGRHDLSARYLGHPTYFPSTAVPVGHTVNPQ
jgi:hypothetical protein